MSLDESSPDIGSTGEGRRARAADRASGAALAALMLAALALVLRTVIGVASGPPPPRAGALAPGFSLRTPNGDGIRLADYRGKVVLVDFWATWCPPCVASMPTLERLHGDFGARGFSVLGVNQEAGDETLVRNFLAERGLTFPIAMDDGRTAREFGVYSFPTSFLVGRDGRIRETYRGLASESRIRSDLESALTTTSSEAPTVEGGAR